MLKQPCTAIRGAHAENSLGPPVIQDVVNLADDLVLHTFEILVHSLQAGRKSRSVPRNPRGSQYERDGSLKIVGGFHATVRGFVRHRFIGSQSREIVRRFRDYADHFARVHVPIPQETFWSGHPPANDRSVTTKEKTRSAITVCCCQTSNISVTSYHTEEAVRPW